MRPQLRLQNIYSCGMGRRKTASVQRVEIEHMVVPDAQERLHRAFDLILRAAKRNRQSHDETGNETKRGRGESNADSR